MEDPQSPHHHSDDCHCPILVESLPIEKLQGVPVEASLFFYHETSPVAAGGNGVATVGRVGSIRLVIHVSYEES